MTRAIAIIVAFFAVLGLAGGYVYLRSKFTTPAATQARPNAPRELQIQVAEDEIYLRKGQAVIGGTVRNVSPETLENVSLTLELKHKDGQTETRSIAIEPQTLTPAAEGRYKLLLPPGKLSGARILRVNRGELALNFKTTTGNLRLMETPPPSRKTIVVERPRSKAGDDFINTPDNPYTLR